MDNSTAAVLLATVLTVGFAGATDLQPGDATVRVDVRVTYDATANGSGEATTATVPTVSG